ncbi:hypothetical protein [uncultured Jannaschia sp.]|uniref:hypothetical protein n=1 Tax=uncultured Jannaschia sp. TaxID=293347 RepID=UPI00263652CB|nr:hypothetical protein [uncultured Jannaschia sp.]
MHRLLLCTALVAGAGPATAQERSWWDLIDPDRLAAQVIQYGLVALRTQVDLTYSDLSVSLLEGRTALEGVEMVLPPEMTGAVPCPISAGRIEIATDEPLAVARYAGRISLRDLVLPKTCLPLAAMAVAASLPGDTMALSELVIDYAYDVPSAGLVADARARIDGLLGLRVSAEFDYLWFRGEEPDVEAVARLSQASVTVENLGGWEIARPFLPPPLVDPEQSAAFIEGNATDALDSLAPGPLPQAAQDFAAALGRGWAEFVAAPDRIVIETGFAPGAPRPVDWNDLARIGSDPLPAILLLEPTIGRSTAAERDVLPVELVRMARETPERLSPEARRAVGLALLEGARAPRNPGLARDLLTPLAQDGDGEVALALARALADTDPQAAYAQALAAGPTGTPGLGNLLDDLERDLPFATVLRMQDAAPEPGPDDLAAPTRELRARAEAHLRGIGATRSLRVALIYATVAAASGDRAAADLLTRIDRAVPAEASGTWAPVAQEAASRATDAWLAR